MALSTPRQAKNEELGENCENEMAENESKSDEDSATAGNAGWADSIAKVLNTAKPKTKQSLVLSRAKKLKNKDNALKSEKVNYGFEVEGEEVKEEKPDKEQLDEDIKQRKNIKLALRVKPSWKDIERERTLRKIATRGVVQLFNAVRIQQKELQVQLEEAGPLDSRRDAVLNNIDKKKFLDVLMSGHRAKSEAVDNAVKKEEDEDSDFDNDAGSGEELQTTHKRKKEWDVLKPDFMTNKKIKHWDEEESSDNETSGGEESSDNE